MKNTKSRIILLMILLIATTTIIVVEAQDRRITVEDKIKKVATSISSYDNAEWVKFTAPVAGTYQFKVIRINTHGNPTTSTRVAMAWK